MSELTRTDRERVHALHLKEGEGLSKSERAELNAYLERMAPGYTLKNRWREIDWWRCDVCGVQNPETSTACGYCDAPALEADRSGEILVRAEEGEE
jgi:hypothetical protein